MATLLSSIRKALGASREPLIPAILMWQSETGAIQDCPAEIRSIDKDTLQIECRRDFPIGFALLVRTAPPMEPVKAVVESRDTDPEGSVTRLNLALIRNERRQAQRFPSGGSVVVRRVDDGAGQPFIVQVLDQSDSGMKVKSRIEIESGAVLTLEGETIMLSAVVCHCRPDGIQYRLGIEFLGEPTRGAKYQSPSKLAQIEVP